jgi:hypothetical protein
MFFLLRVGIVTSTLSVVYFWEQRPRLLGARWKWASPMAVFGHSSQAVEGLLPRRVGEHVARVAHLAEGAGGTGEVGRDVAGAPGEGYGCDGVHDVSE